VQASDFAVNVEVVRKARQHLIRQAAVGLVWHVR
jgi:hypothetical protein